MRLTRILFVSFLLTWVQPFIQSPKLFAASPYHSLVAGVSEFPLEPIEPIKKKRIKKQKRSKSPDSQASRKDKNYNIWVIFFILAFVMMVPLILFLVHYLKGNLAVWATMFALMIAYYLSGLIAAFFSKGKSLGGLLIFSAIAGLVCIAFGIANSLKIIWVGGLILLGLAIIILLDYMRNAIQQNKTPIQ